MKRISAKTGRGLLIALVILVALTTFITLFWIARGGAIHPDTRRDAMNQLLGVYLPLIAVMAGFYIGEPTATRKTLSDTPGGALAMAVVITGIWVLIPFILLLATETIEEALRTLKVLNPYGQSVGNGFVVFYFSKGHK